MDISALRLGDLVTQEALYIDITSLLAGHRIDIIENDLLSVVNDDSQLEFLGFARSNVDRFRDLIRLDVLRRAHEVVDIFHREHIDPHLKFSLLYIRCLRVEKRPCFHVFFY